MFEHVIDRGRKIALEMIADVLGGMDDLDLVQIAGDIDAYDSSFDGAFSVYEISDLCDCLPADDVALAIFESGATDFCDRVRHTDYGWEIVTPEDLIYDATDFYLEDIAAWLLDNDVSILWPDCYTGDVITAIVATYYEDLYRAA